MTHSPEYKSWTSMKGRCVYRNPRKDYAGRGITICDRWLNSFENFLEDMGPKPSPKHSIDRINNDGNYEPENCRWATRIEQARNKRNVRLVEINGENKTVEEWLTEYGISRVSVWNREKRGMNIVDAITAPKVKTICIQNLKQFQNTSARKGAA